MLIKMKTKKQFVFLRMIFIIPEELLLENVGFASIQRISKVFGLKKIDPLINICLFFLIKFFLFQV